jgi:hypothetical protein
LAAAFALARIAACVAVFVPPAVNPAAVRAAPTLPWAAPDAVEAAALASPAAAPIGFRKAPQPVFKHIIAIAHTGRRTFLIRTLDPTKKTAQCQSRSMAHLLESHLRVGVKPASSSQSMLAPG